MLLDPANTYGCRSIVPHDRPKNSISLVEASNKAQHDFTAGCGLSQGAGG
jgi:hypothetical protein